MKQTGKLREVPIQNYLILAMLFVGVILLLWYFSSWYRVYDDYQKETPVIRGTLSEITNLELEHYIMEHPTTAIYMCTSSASKCRGFENRLKTMLESNTKLKSNMIYLNLSDINQDEFVQKFNSSYPYKVKLTPNYPAIVLFEDSKIIGLLQEKEDKTLDVNDVRSYLKLHQVNEEE